jgi:cardiolipin synthase A/B
MHPWLLSLLIGIGALGVIFGLWAATHATLYKRDNGDALLWSTICLLVPVVGPALYLGFGINRIERRAVLLRRRRLTQPSPRQADPERDSAGGVEPAFRPLAHVVHDLTGMPLLAGNRITPLGTGDTAYPAMLKAIADARRSVTLASYLFDGDAVGRQFARELGNAARRGVEVRVLIDASGVLFSRHRIVGRLRGEGVPYAQFLPAFSFSRPVGFNLRNHRKLMVVDGCVGFTGGMNIVAAHYLSRQPSHPVADIHFRVEGPVVEQLQDAFADDWVFTTGEVLAGPAWFPPILPAGNSLARGIADGPDEPTQKLRWTLLASIALARRSLKIATPYFLPDQPIVSALNVAAMRGVSVEIVLPSHGDVPFVQWASEALWWQLLEHGCRIWVTGEPFDHSKVFIVDDAWVLVGSPNWDNRSLRLNFEFGLECYDRALAGELTNWFAGRRASAREVTFSEVESRPALVRLRDGIARLAAPLM